MKKVLFIDRDGTLIIEPPTDYQVDSLAKLKFYPGVFKWLSRIVDELDYSLVMVTNQDGLGTDSFPEEDFWPPHFLMLETFYGEGIKFDEVLIDRSFEHEGLPTRKPGIGMFGQYLSGDFDLNSSYVIGDRISDIALAKNLNARGILIADEQMESLPDFEESLRTQSWEDIYKYLKLQDRTAANSRVTNETNIEIQLNLDGTGKAQIHTGIAFFDHMLDQLARHGLVDLDIKVRGDLHIDEHHTIEDTAIALGETFAKALGNKLGVERYGYCLPMDDCLAQVALDFGGRSWLVWEAEFRREMIGQMPTEMFLHFFKSFSDAAKCNLNIKAEGVNEHHKIEAIFKAFAKAIKMAVKRDINHMILPSTKGSL